MKIRRSVLSFLYTLAIYVGLPLLGWGLDNLPGFFSIGQRIGYAVSIAAFGTLAGYLIQRPEGMGSMLGKREGWAGLIADGAFRRAGTTVKPFQESSALLTDGVYGFSRHPMYLGFVLILAGVAILLGSLTPWVIIPIFVALMEVVFIQVEECMLEEKFGPAWLAYKKRVRRWI